MEERDADVEDCAVLPVTALELLFGDSIGRLGAPCGMMGASVLELEAFAPRDLVNGMCGDKVWLACGRGPEGVAGEVDPAVPTGATGIWLRTGKGGAAERVGMCGEASGAGASLLPLAVTAELEPLATGGLMLWAHFSASEQVAA